MTQNVLFFFPFHYCFNFFFHNLFCIQHMFFTEFFLKIWLLFIKRYFILWAPLMVSRTVNATIGQVSNLARCIAKMLVDLADWKVSSQLDIFSLKFYWSAETGNWKICVFTNWHQNNFCEILLTFQLLCVGNFFFSNSLIPLVFIFGTSKLGNGSDQDRWTCPQVTTNEAQGHKVLLLFPRQGYLKQ